MKSFFDNKQNQGVEDNPINKKENKNNNDYKKKNVTISLNFTNMKIL